MSSSRIPCGSPFGRVGNIVLMNMTDSTRQSRFESDLKELR